jgi:hypothetical protein
VIDPIEVRSLSLSFDRGGGRVIPGPAAWFPCDDYAPGIPAGRMRLRRGADAMGPAIVIMPCFEG